MLPYTYLHIPVVSHLDQETIEARVYAKKESSPSLLFVQFPAANTLSAQNPYQICQSRRIEET